MLMDAQMETWDSVDHSQTRTRYYCGKSSEPSSGRVWYSFHYNEDLEQVASRTMEAFERSLDKKWDYMARPHSSTYVHKANLVKFCETLPEKDVICGILTEGKEPFIWGGCHYVFSRDVIERFVANKERWDTSVMEDHSITRMANHLGIPVTGGHSSSINQNNGTYTVFVYGHGENASFSDFSDIGHILDGHFFVRVKQDMQQGRRRSDNAGITETFQMIDTIQCKEQQLSKGYFQVGNGPLQVLILGSCRTVPYAEYLCRSPELTVRRIDPCDWTLCGMDLNQFETDERILNVLKSTNIFIHEYLENYGMFNTEKADSKTFTSSDSNQRWTLRFQTLTTT